MAPKFTLFGGGLLSLNFGGGGKRRGGRGKGGLLRRLGGLVGKGLQEMRGGGGKPSGGKAPGGSGGKTPGGPASSASFAAFRADRPDLFDGDDQGPEGDDQGDDEGDDDAYRMPDQSGDQGHHWQAPCPSCDHAPGGHADDCPYGWHL